MSIGRKMQKLREMRGITTQEMADVVHVSQPQICKWEAGIAIPNVVAAVLIARRLGTTVEQLVGEED